VDYGAYCLWNRHYSSYNITRQIATVLGAYDGFIPHCHIQLNVRNDESGGYQTVKDALRQLHV